jgi:hypothetical protein
MIIIAIEPINQTQYYMNIIYWIFQILCFILVILSMFGYSQFVYWANYLITARIILRICDLEGTAEIDCRKWSYISQI